LGTQQPDVYVPLNLGLRRTAHNHYKKAKQSFLIHVIPF
jgi:hypothetical protein